MQHGRTRAQIASITIGSKAFHVKVYRPSSPFDGAEVQIGPLDSLLSMESDEFYIEFSLTTPLEHKYQGSIRLVHDDSKSMLAALQELKKTFGRDRWGYIAGIDFYVEHDQTQGTIRLTDYQGNEQYKLPQSSACRIVFKAQKDVAVVPFI